MTLSVIFGVSYCTLLGAERENGNYKLVPIVQQFHSRAVRLQSCTDLDSTHWHPQKQPP